MTLYALRRPKPGHLLLAVVALALVAVYAIWAVQVLDSRVNRQIEVTGFPFAISDLFPRWLGAKALLAGQDPYSASFTAELHRQYYGRTMAPEEEMALFRNICEFFYPAYVVLPLLPLLWLPFEAVRWIGTAAMAGAVMWCVWAWLGLIGVRSRPSRATAAVAALLFYPAIDLILLQQLTGLVLAYLVGAYVLMARRCYLWAGVLLGLAMIKPQGAAIPVAAMLFWALWRRHRWPLLGAFGATMAAQLAVAQALLPSWIGEFLAASARYQRFNTISLWLPGQIFNSVVWGAALIAGPLAALVGYCWWRHRMDEADSPVLIRVMALTFTASVVLMPDISFYNKTFLLPAILCAAAASGENRLAQRLSRRLALMSLAMPVVLFAVAAVLFWRWVPLQMSDVRDVTGPLTDNVQAFFMVLPLFVLPSAIVQCMSLPATNKRLPATLSLSAWLPPGASYSAGQVVNSHVAGN